MAEEERRLPGTSEEEPLLGAPGDASQQEGKPLYYNFITGTGLVAQFGAWILVAIIWGAVFSNDVILFSAHPILNSAALLFFVQAILVLQPTHTAKQKKEGTYTHAALIDIAILAAIAGCVIIEYNKIDHGGTHFESLHARLGLITYILVVIQFVVGFTQYFTPGLYGSVDQAKALYKYHRMSGYVILLFMLATICAATQTGFNVTTLHIKLWTVVVASVILVMGLAPRIKLNKFGWMAGK